MDSGLEVWNEDDVQYDTGIQYRENRCRILVPDGGNSRLWYRVVVPAHQATKAGTATYAIVDYIP
jgi:hypothetical protein